MRKIILLVFLSISARSYADLNAGVCAGLIVDEIKTIAPITNESIVITYWTKICQGLIDHLKTDAVIGKIPGPPLLDSLGFPTQGVTGEASGTIK